MTNIGFRAALAVAMMAATPVLAAGNQHDKTGGAPPPSIATGQCNVNASAYSVSTDLQKTGSKNFVDVTGTTVSFTQGASGCVEISFAAEAATNPGEIIVTQAMLDGNVCSPFDNQFASDSPSADLSDHAMNYICPAVSAGAHTAKIQFKSRFGGKVALDYRSTIVRFAK